MASEDIVAGDIVRCSTGGRIFHAVVRGRVAASLTVQPIEKGVTVRRVGVDDVIDHWAHRPREQEEHPEQRSLGDLWDR